MGSVTVYSIAKMEELLNAGVVSASITDGVLSVTKRDGTTSEVGSLLTGMPDASDTVKGLVELATDAETIAGAATGLAVTPFALAALTANSSQKGLVELATTAEATTGTDTTRAVTPVGLKAVGDTKQPLNSDLTSISALVPTNDDIIQRKTGAWINRTMSQLATDLIGTGQFAGGGGGGTTYVPFKTVGPTGSGADYEVDGTADNVQIQAALDSLAGGGAVLLAPGTYNLAASSPVTFVGNDTYDGVTKMLIGAGAHSTTLVAPANTHCISITSAASCVIKNMGFRVAGSGSAIVSTMGSGTPLLYQAFRDSLFENLYFAKNGVGAHTGWAMNLGSPFRSRFANLEVFNLHNGFRLYSQNANFNPGDCTFDRSFIELDNVSGSIGLHLDSPVANASMNQITFNMIEFIDDAASGTAILLNGGGAPNHNTFTGINIEQFATVINVDTGTGNRFDLNYVESIAAGTFFKFGANSNGNKIRHVGMAMVGTKTNAVINDANTWAENPNSLEDCYIAVEAAGVANATITATTRIEQIRGYNNGTLAAELAFGSRSVGGVKRADTIYLTGGAAVPAGTPAGTLIVRTA